MDENEFKRVLGLKIREYRENKKLTISRVAEDASVDEKYLGKLENGRYSPKFYTIIKLVKALDINGEFLDELMKEVNVNHDE